MQSGKLRHRARLYRRSVVKNQYAEPVATWTHYGFAWVGIAEQFADETDQAGRLVMNTVATIRMRYRTDLSPKDRLEIAGSTYEIASIIDVDLRHKELAIRCTKTE